MKRILLLLLLTALLPLCTTAEAPVTFADDIVRSYMYPEGTDEETARYVYRCTYPQLAGESEVAGLINNTYQYLADDALGFECPMNATTVPEDGPQMLVTVTYEITHLSSSHLAVLIRKEVRWGEDVSHIVSGHVFPLTGPEAGEATSLPYLLGILKPGETDEWYLDRQIAKADACARELVWELLMADKASGKYPIWDDLTYEEIEWSFYPEEDFCLDAEGNVLFLLQEGSFAPAEYGPLQYTISLDTLLDEI